MHLSSLPLFTLETSSAFPFPATFPCGLWPPLQQNTPPENHNSHPIKPHPDPNTTAAPPNRFHSQTSPGTSSFTFSHLHHQLPPGNRCLQQHSPLLSRAISAHAPRVQHLDHCKNIPKPPTPARWDPKSAVRSSALSHKPEPPSLGDLLGGLGERAELDVGVGPSAERSSTAAPSRAGCGRASEKSRDKAA